MAHNEDQMFTFTGSHILGSFGGRLISAGAHIGGDTGATLACDRREERHVKTASYLSVCIRDLYAQLHRCAVSQKGGGAVSQYYNRCNKTTIGHFGPIARSLAEP